MCDCKSPFRKYSFVTREYDGAEALIWPEWTNGFAIHNNGTTDLFINGDKIPAGESKSVGGNKDELFDYAAVDIRFMTPTPAPPIVTNLAVLTIKYYIIVRL